MSLSHRLLHGTFWSLSGAIISRIAAVITVTILGRLFGKEGFGTYALIVSTLVLISPVAGSPFFYLASRHIAGWRVTDPDRCGGVILLSWLGAAIMGTLLAAGQCYYADVLAHDFVELPEVAPLLWFAAPYMLFGSLIAVGNGVLVGFTAYRAQTSISSVTALVYLPITAVLAWKYGVGGAIIALCIQGLVTSVWMGIKTVQLVKTDHIRLAWKWVWPLVPLLWSYALPMMVAMATVGLANYFGNVLLVQVEGGQAEMGLFSAANYLRGIVILLPAAVAPVMMPLMMAALVGTESEKNFPRIAALNTRLIGMLVFPIAIVAVVAARGIIVLLYGKDFQEGWGVMVVIAGAVSLQALAMSVGQILLSRARMWLFAFINTVMAVVFLAGCYFLVTPLRAEGLAISYLASFSVQFALIMLVRARYLAAPVLGTEVRLLLAAGLTMGLAVVLVIILPLVAGAIVAIPFAVLSTAWMFWMGFDGPERQVALSAAKVALRRRLGREAAAPPVIKEGI